MYPEMLSSQPTETLTSLGDAGAILHRPAGLPAAVNTGNGLDVLPDRGPIHALKQYPNKVSF